MQRIQFGVGPITCQTLNGSKEESAEQFELAVRSAQAAEESGLTSLWMSEHHFSDDGYLPSPLVLSAALARETSSLRLGTAVALGPLYEPIRLVEEAAVLDHLSQGRFSLGLGLGYRAVEFAAFGLEEASRVARLERCINVARRAWNGEALERVGLLEGDDTIKLTPLPMTQGGPKVLLGAFVTAGVQRAARIADGWISPTMANVEQLERKLAILEEAEAFSRSTFHLVVSLSGFFSPHGAWDLCGTGVDRVGRQYRRWFMQDGAPVSTPHSSESGEPLPPPGFIAGDPEQAAQHLAPWLLALNKLPPNATADVVVRLHYPGVSSDSTLDAIRLFGMEVVPAARKLALTNE